MGGQYLSYFHQKKKNKYGQNKAVGKPTVFILSQEIDYNRADSERTLKITQNLSQCRETL